MPWHVFITGKALFLLLCVRWEHRVVFLLLCVRWEHGCRTGLSLGGLLQPTMGWV